LRSSLILFAGPASEGSWPKSIVLPRPKHVTFDAIEIMRRLYRGEIALAPS
jgi:hypothetical protein